MIASSQVLPGEGAIFLPGSTRPIDLARELIQKGANVNAQSKSGVTALMIAAARNVAPMIGLLVQSGAKTDLKNAARQDGAEIAELNGSEAGGEGHQAAQQGDGGEQQLMPARPQNVGSAEYARSPAGGSVGHPCACVAGKCRRR